MSLLRLIWLNVSFYALLVVFSLLAVPALTYFVQVSLRRSSATVIPAGEPITITVRNVVKIYDDYSRFVREWRKGERQRARRQRELTELDRDLQRRQREFREDLNQRRNEELQGLLERAQRIVRQIAEQEKFDLVVQDAVFFSPRVDITEKVLRALNAPK